MKVNNYLQLDVPYEGQTTVLHYLEVLRDRIGWDAVAAKVQNPLKGKKIGVPGLADAATVVSKAHETFTSLKVGRDRRRSLASVPFYGPPLSPVPRGRKFC